VSPTARHWGRLALRLAAAALAVAGALALLLAWRLARGPIELAFLTPHVEPALGRADGLLAVRVGSTALVWDRRRHDLRLRVRDLKAFGATGEPIATVPVLTLRLSLAGLVRGVIAPAEIALEGARLRLVLQPDGSIDLGLGAETQATTRSSLRALADDFFGAPSAARPAGWLRAVVLRDGEVELFDPGSASLWQARQVDLVLHPEDSGLAARLSGRVPVGSRIVPVSVDARWRRDPERVDVLVAFRGLDPSAVGVPAPAASDLLRFVSGVRVPLDGRIALTLDGTLDPERARVKLVGGAGSVRLPGVPGADVGLERLRAALAIDPGENRMRLEVVSLDTGRATVRLRGLVRGLRGPGTVDLEAAVTDLPAGEIGRYWPEGVAAAARGWVTANVAGGEVHTARARLTGAVNDAAPASFTLETVTGSLVFGGLAVRYLDPMSPLTRVAGTGTLSQHGLSLRVARGAVAGLELVRATVDLGGEGPPRMAVDATVRGPLARALALLDEPPLALMHARGIAPGHVSGTITARLRLAVPLDGAPPDPGTLQPTVSGTLRGVTVARLPRGWTLTAGELALELAAGAMRVTGDGRLQGVPVALASHEDLAGGGRSVDLRSHVDAAELGSLGLDWLPRFEGRVGVQARYTEALAGAGKLHLDLDLSDVIVALPPLEARRPSADPERARVELGLSGGTVRTVDDLDLRLGRTRVMGRATLSDDGRWQTIDARAVLEAPIPARPAGNASLTLRPGPQQSRLTLASDDAGALLEALETQLDLQGGRLTFSGAVDQTESGWPLEGRLDVGAFTLKRAPVVARAASLVSLSGIVRALSGKGIAFDRLSADIAQRGGVVTIHDARATGRSLAISVRGTVDLGAGTVALEGTLVPEYYGVNRAARGLPVVGEVLTGVRREGMQVFDFAAKGPLGNPTVSARASSLAPGVMRDLLRLLGR
jgi:hypothetical protein